MEDRRAVTRSLAAALLPVLLIATADAAPPRRFPQDERERLEELYNDRPVRSERAGRDQSQRGAGDPEQNNEQSAPRGHDVSRALREDAQLNRVTFVDENNGWAVGDRGTLWRTGDGGHRWQLESTGVDCRLESVSFVSSKLGWAAGGYSQPYTHASAGVILRSEDGGRRWTRDRKLLLPRVRYIKFFDASRGWAIAEPSALFPSGIFSTTDGGRSWSALAAEASLASWLCGDFPDRVGGVLAGGGGRLAFTAAQSVRAVQGLESSLRTWHGVHLDTPRHGYVVGDGGRLLVTADRGRSWQPPPGSLPRGTGAFDWLTVAAHGDHAWAAGAPGSRILRTADGGRTWELCPTGCRVPLRHLTFIDDDRGWAVGDLGTILHTTDGGRSWAVQRAASRRAAWAGFYARAEDVPLELVASLGADGGYLGAVEVVCRSDLEQPDACDDTATVRLQEAIARAGGSAAYQAWQLPVRHTLLRLPREQVTAIWDRLHEQRGSDPGGIAQLESHLVMRMRMWRPSVLFVSAEKPDDAVSQLVSQVALRAIEKAADAKQYPDQIAVAGLEPWSVEKVYAALPSGQTGSINLAPTQLAARMGRSLADLAANARATLADAPAAAPRSMGFRLLVDRVPQQTGNRDFMSGVSMEATGAPKRPPMVAAAEGIDQLRRRAQWRRNAQAILAQASTRDGQGAGLSAQGAQLTRGFDKETAAELLFELAKGHLESGNLDRTAETFESLVAQHPHHPLCGAALAWLVDYYTSGETLQPPERSPVQSATAVLPGGSAALAELATPAGKSALGDARQVSSKVIAGGDERRAQRGLLCARKLEDTEPLFFAEPAVQLKLAAAHRQQGRDREALSLVAALRASRPHDTWWACADAERWLTDRKQQCAKPVWTCRRATARPKLDGKLDDPLWKECTAAELHSAQGDDGQWPAVAMLAWDDEFLYLAASCRKAPGALYPASTARRARDADVTATDRVELLLDVDRDWGRSFRLAVDYRGWTSDSCGPLTSWNPKWYVAASADDAQWTAEAAIPLAALTREKPKSQAAWAMGLQRVVPRVGFQSWSEPACPEPLPQGYGLLIFQ